MAYYLNHDFLKEAPLKNKLYLKLKLNKFSNIIRKCRRYFEKQSNNHIRTDLIPFCESTLDEQSENFNKDHYCFIQNIFERNFYEIILNNWPKNTFFKAPYNIAKYYNKGFKYVKGQKVDHIEFFPWIEYLLEYLKSENLNKITKNF